ncbi:MAG TPA: phosphatase PAP2 family protein [Mycobacteriales bacterium]|nr:phosphatase PAP2 family protein [Mycobacteriales bacterium]
MNSWDAHVERSVHAFVLGHRWVFHLASWLTHLGDPLVVTLATIALSAVLLARGARRAAVFVLAVRAVAIVADTGLKHAVDRTRPVLAHPLATAAGASFPSGHAFGSAALWGTFAALLPAPRWARLATAVVVPVVVAATRVLLGVHYVSDVLAGLLLGWAAAALGAKAFGVPRPGSPSMAPVHEVNDR